jgi:hypothetical protein
MRDPRNALMPFLMTESATAREAIAARLYKLDGVKSAIIEAATRGEQAVRISDRALLVDLRGTETAKKLADWIQQNGMTMEWLERQVERPNGLKVMIGEPVISWGHESYRFS